MTQQPLDVTSAALRDPNPRPDVAYSIRELFESSPDLFCCHDLDGRILAANPAACAALGIPRRQLLGMRIQDVLAPEFQTDFAHYMTTLTGTRHAEGTMNVATVRGKRVWEYRNTLVIDDCGYPLVWGIARDVTEREELLREGRRSDRRFRSILDNVSDIIAIIDCSGGLTYSSPSLKRALGTVGDVEVGHAFTDLVDPADRERWSAFIQNQMLAGDDTPGTIELRLRQEEGAPRIFEIVAKNFLERRTVTSVLLTARDVADRRLLETQLAREQRLSGLGKLAATVAHEFNNVLMGMQPFAELMMRPSATSGMVSKGATHIANSIQRGKRIALDILRFTQPAEPIFACIDLGEFWQTFAPEAEGVLGNSIRMLSRIPFRGMTVRADRSQLSQVIANLVSNARDAMPHGGTFSIEARIPPADATFPFGYVEAPDTFVHLVVSDTGSGMPLEIRQHIFEPLFTTKRTGTGLGLSVVHQVLTHHGGHIFVESEPERGTTFHILLPRAVEVEETAPPIEKPVEPQAGRILIVEDEDLIAEGLSIILTGDGFDVRRIAAGRDAEATVRRYQPNLVLLDLGLPDMDGMQVYAAIRKVDPKVPVIFATGHGDGTAIQKALCDPNTRFLQKPFELTTLAEVIADLEAHRL